MRRDFEEVTKGNESSAGEMQRLAAELDKAVAEEAALAPAARGVARVGKMDARQHLDRHLHSLMSANIVQCMATMLDTLVF